MNKKKVIHKVEDYENPFIAERYLVDDGKSYNDFEKFRKFILNLLK